MVTYISPAKESLAAATVDIIHCMQPSHEIAILVGTKAHIHPGCDIDPRSTCIYKNLQWIVVQILNDQLYVILNSFYYLQLANANNDVDNYIFVRLSETNG